MTVSQQPAYQAVEAATLLQLDWVLAGGCQGPAYCQQVASSDSSCQDNATALPCTSNHSAAGLGLTLVDQAYVEALSKCAS